MSTATDRITLRSPTSDDVEPLSQILYDAFGGIHDQHGFQRDFPNPETARGMMSAWIPHPKVWGVVAEIDGRIVGSNFIDERDPILGIGPITIDPRVQNSGVGRRLMEAVIEHGSGAPGIRLVQDGFHMRSLSLYTSLGFEVTAPCIVMAGKPRSGPVTGVRVRPLEESDFDECEALCVKVHGFERTGSLRDARYTSTPLVAERGGRIVAYAAAPGYWPMSHGVAETDEDMKALFLAAADGGEPVALLVPLLSGLFSWCLEEGLRALKPMNVMAMGSYQEPRGSWYPSVLY